MADALQQALNIQDDSLGKAHYRDGTAVGRQEGGAAAPGLFQFEYRKSSGPISGF